MSHKISTEKFNKALGSPSKIVQFFTSGISYFLSKNNELRDPRKFRSVTCLPIGYKIFTSIIGSKINDHLTNNDMIVWQQNGRKAKRKDPMEWLVLDYVVANHAKNK